MIRKKIIALSGKMGSGKSTIARHVYNKLDDAMIIPLAGVAKQCIEIITGVAMDEKQPDGSYDYSQKQKGMLLRSGMPLGVFIREFAEASRGFDKTIWIDSTFNTIEGSNRKHYIIPDLRMLTEYDFLLGLTNSDEYEVYMFRIESALSKDKDGRSMSHVTESELDGKQFDAVYKNAPPLHNAELIAKQIVNYIR